jgi:hypothetical protein
MVLEEEEGARMRKIEARALLVCIAVFLIPALAAAESSALILSSVPGVPEYGEKYAKWAQDTRKALIDKFGFTPERIIMLSDKQTAKAEVEKAFAQLKTQLKTNDTFFLFFIGHGSYGDTAQGVQYKFHSPSPQMTGADFNKLLSTLTVSRTVIVNSTNASGGSIEALGGRNRLIITATKSGGEGNETRFHEYFLAALQNADSDEDKDKKVSVWEAFKYAAAGVDRFYKTEGQIATEHPQISVNGAPPTAAAVQEKDIPVMARVTSFQVDRPVVVADARLQALYNERKDIEQKIETLRINKSSMSEADYEKALEDLTLQLAQKNQQIREQEKKK